MNIYKIYATTDGKFVGMDFTIDETNKTIDIIGVCEVHCISEYDYIKKENDRVRIVNVNYTLKGILIKP
jgi:hypothetical protein